MARSPSFLAHYRDHGTPAARLERVLAVGRAFLTASAFIAIYLDPTEPTRLAGLTYAVLFSYSLYSIAVLVLVHARLQIRPVHGRALHGLDILWTSALTLVSEGPVSPFFLFFLFVVAASAYRGGFRETAATAVITVAVFLAETVILARGPWPETWLSAIDFELNRTILRVTYLLLTGFLLGYLAEQDKQLRAELAALADLPRQPRLDLGVRGSITTLGSALLRTFNAAAVLFVVKEQGAGAWLWRVTADAGAGDGGPVAATRTELTAGDEEGWLFTAPGRAWHAAIPTGDQGALFRVARAGVWSLERVQGELPDPVAALPESTLSAVDIGFDSQWRGRIYLVDMRAAASLEQVVHFLEGAADQLGPVLTNVLLHRRLRSEDSAAERARVARELHDGAIQALFGIEMKLQALRRRHSLDPAVERELGEVQDLVRGEVLELRQLMQALRPIELDANEKLPDVLASIVERFGRESGMSARFVSGGHPGALNPAAALEVVRIVQEALVNVRKHSRARNVLVRMAQEHGGTHRLVIEDDGQGFPFAGRLSAPALHEQRVGPAIIKERARLLGADLTVHSQPGVGARIELTIPGGSYA